MLVLSNTAAQTLAAGQSLTFNAIKQSGRCKSELVNGSGTSAVFLKDGGMYLVDFTGTVTGTTAAAPVQLQLQVNGAPLTETLREVTITAAGDLHNMAFGTAVSTAGPCGFDIGSPSITVTNTGANPITVNAGFALRVVRVG